MLLQGTGPPKENRPSKGNSSFHAQPSENLRQKRSEMTAPYRFVNNLGRHFQWEAFLIRLYSVCLSSV